MLQQSDVLPPFLYSLIIVPLPLCVRVGGGTAHDLWNLGQNRLKSTLDKLHPLYVHYAHIDVSITIEPNLVIFFLFTHSHPSTLSTGAKKRDPGKKVAPYLSNTPTNLCMALLNFLLFYFIL